MKFKLNEKVIIKKYKKDEVNRVGFVQSITAKDRYWIIGLNMPFQGTVSEILSSKELKKIKN